MPCIEDSLPMANKPTGNQSTTNQLLSNADPDFRDNTASNLDSQEEIHLFPVIRTDIVAEVNSLLTHTEAPTSSQPYPYYIRDGPLAGGLFFRTHAIAGAWIPFSLPRNPLWMVPYPIRNAVGNHRPRRGAISQQGGHVPDIFEDPFSEEKKRLARLRGLTRKMIGKQEFQGELPEDELQGELPENELQGELPKNDYRDRRINTIYARKLINEGLENEQMQDKQIPAAQRKKSASARTLSLRDFWASFPKAQMKWEQSEWGSD